MLSRILSLVKSSKYCIAENTLYCNDYLIKDISLLTFLEENNILEDPLSSKSLNDKINICMSLVYLNSIGFYEDEGAFIAKNKYEIVTTDCCFLELDESDSNVFLNRHKILLLLIKSIESISKHIYSELDVKNSIIFREDKSLFLSFIYSENTVNNLTVQTSNNITDFEAILKDRSSEKKLIYINELIDYLQIIDERNRFDFLLNNFDNYYEKCINSYQYYLRDFSYNKLKIEIDTKALDFAQKIQTAINDAQTKLIAIPTAFVLVTTVFDFENISNSKNIASIISLFIFSFFIQLFLNNQKSILKFIKVNINSYKLTLSNNINVLKSSNFSEVEAELQKQNNRLKIIAFLLWTIPIFLFLYWILCMDFGALYFLTLYF